MSPRSSTFPLEVVGEDMGVQSSFTQQLNNGMQQADRLTWAFKAGLKRDTESRLRFLTFARRRSTVVLQVGAVLAFVVFGTFAQVVRGQVETLRAVLTRVGLAVIDVQLHRGKI